MTEQLSFFGVAGQVTLYETEDAQPTLFPPRQVPQMVIDKALYTAGNSYGSAYRVAAFYMREHPEKENVDFLRREFSVNNGRGIEHDGRKYAVWFRRMVSSWPAAPVSERAMTAPRSYGNRYRRAFWSCWRLGRSCLHRSWNRHRTMC